MLTDAPGLPEYTGFAGIPHPAEPRVAAAMWERRWRTIVFIRTRVPDRQPDQLRLVGIDPERDLE